MRILVAGGAGFIGSHLCERLLRDGDEVICVDNFSTGNMNNVEIFSGHIRYTILHHDVIDSPPPVDNLDRVYHLASPASPVGYQRLSIETLRVNSEGTRNLLELSANCGARFLYASTSEVYGDPLEHPQTETYRGNVSPIGPRSMYDEGKRYGEALSLAYHRSRAVDVRIARIFNTYGPRSDPYDGRLIPNFLRQALEGGPLTIYGDGSQTRSLAYVSDTVDALVLMMETNGASGQVVNIGNPGERSILEIADCVRSLVSEDLALAFHEPPVGDDPQRRCPDIRLAKQLLGWEPQIRLEDGLARTYQWFSSTFAR